MAGTASTAKKKQRFLQAIRDGFSVTGAASKAGAGRRTVYGWRDRDSKFAAQWDEAWESRGDWYEDQNREQALLGNMAAILNGLKMHHRIQDKHHHTVDLRVEEEAKRIGDQYGLDPNQIIERAKQLEALQ